MPYSYTLQDFYQKVDSYSIKDLENLIIDARKAYYNKSPFMDDDTFDKLIDKLEELDPSNKLLIDVGANISDDSKKIKLPYFMGSMNKYKDEKSINNWIKKYNGNKYVITDKLDGISVMFYYNSKNKTYSLYTRGNGTIGSNISHIVEYINDIPSMYEISKNVHDDLYVRGELIMKKSDFNKYYKSSTEARNIVSGLVGSKTMKEDELSRIDLVVYSCLSCDGLSISQQFDYLNKLGFNVVNYNVVNDITLDKLSKTLIDNKNDSAYQIDGLVIYNNKYYKIVSGENPKYAFAFKSILTHQQAEVIVKEVSWNVSKDLYLSPVVHFDSVEVDGCNIQKATGKNAKFIVDNKIGVGAHIVIIRSGGVIPDILQVIKPASDNVELLPKAYKFSWDDSHTNIYISKNDISGDDGNEYNITLIVHFFKKLEAKGLGPGIVSKLYNGGFTTIKDILDMNVSGLTNANIPGFSTKSINNLIDSISNVKDNLTIEKLMVASNSFGRGISFKNIQAVLKDIPQLKSNLNYKFGIDELVAINGIGTITAQQFLDGYKEYIKFVNNNNLQYLYNSVNSNNIVCNVKKNNSKITGKSFVFTGKRNKELETKIIEFDGKVVSSISSNTDYLVVENDDAKNSSSSKIKKTNELGISIITHDELSKML
jgi:DNA ligase (NAD+)